MRVRVAGVEMVDRHPFETGAEVRLHLAHHVTGEVAQVGKAVAVLRRDDQPEGMPVVLAALDESAAVFDIAFRAVEPAARAVAGRAVALQVSDMRAGGTTAEPVADDPRLHDDPAMSPAGAPLARLPLQPIGNGLAAPDPRAPSLPGRPAAAPATGKLGRGERPAIRLRRRLHDLLDEGQRSPGVRAPAIVDAAGTRMEVGKIGAVHARRGRADPGDGQQQGPDR
jgi:hypothetical protein